MTVHHVVTITNHAQQGPNAPGGRCRRSRQGILKGISTPGVLIGVGTIHHNRLRLLEPADQTAVARHGGRAQSLGFERLVKIRELIARHRQNLNKISILPTVGLFHNGPGRPATEYWLNEKQALFITTQKCLSCHCSFLRFVKS